jgi:3-oxoacyl-[acyl-carrier protein] reductase
MTVDVTDAASLIQLAEAASKGGVLDGIVSAAGIAPGTDPLDITEEMWHQVVAINLTGTFFAVQAAARVMAAQGHGGSIVTISSGVAATGAAQLAHYAASKAGVVGLTKSLALALAKDQIRVNCVAPGGVNTPLYWSRPWRGTTPPPSVAIPLGRLGEPGDLANCICFLLSDLSSWITGQTIHVNGGNLMP